MKGQKEIEARWLNLDPKKVLEDLGKIGAKKEGSFFFKEWIFFHPEWRKDNRRIRVRTDGTKSWVTYKANATWAVDSTQEIEVEVSDAGESVALIKAIGVPLIRYQEKKRDTFAFDGITFDMDLWPKIPMVLEIEGPSEDKVREGASKLGLKWEDAVFVDQAYVHRDYYGLDIFNVSDYRFEA
ncbi:MAG: CYTH domain-containing protein [Patescibacteria group bacterium]|nr:CYTH domain-containing protein [Patescibacteria group bacterium]